MKSRRGPAGRRSAGLIERSTLLVRSIVDGRSGRQRQKERPRPRTGPRAAHGLQPIVSRHKCPLTFCAAHSAKSCSDDGTHQRSVIINRLAQGCCCAASFVLARSVFPGLPRLLMTVGRLVRLLIAFVFGWGLASSSSGEEKPLLFETDIQPLLADKCGKCHGAKVKKGELDLSTMSGLLRGGESGEPAVAETAEDSMLWIMVNGGGMPPEGQPPLTEQELARIRQWIDGGAKSQRPAEVVERQLTQHDVLPIVLLRCTACHGPQRKDGGLDLRTPAAMRKGGKQRAGDCAGRSRRESDDPADRKPKPVRRGNCCSSFL